MSAVPSPKSSAFETSSDGSERGSRFTRPPTPSSAPSVLSPCGAAAPVVPQGLDPQAVAPSRPRGCQKVPLTRNSLRHQGSDTPGIGQIRALHVVGPHGFVCQRHSGRVGHAGLCRFGLVIQSDDAGGRSRAGVQGCACGAFCTRLSVRWRGLRMSLDPSDLLLTGKVATLVRRRPA